MFTKLSFIVALWFGIIIVLSIIVYIVDNLTNKRVINYVLQNDLNRIQNRAKFYADCLCYIKIDYNSAGDSSINSDLLNNQNTSEYAIDKVSLVSPKQKYDKGCYDPPALEFTVNKAGLPYVTEEEKNILKDLIEKNEEHNKQNKCTIMILMMVFFLAIFGFTVFYLVSYNGRELLNNLVLFEGVLFVIITIYLAVLIIYLRIKRNKFEEDYHQTNENNYKRYGFIIVFNNYNDYLFKL